MGAGARSIGAALVCFLPGLVIAQGASRANLSRDLERLSKGELISGLPPADSVSPGPRTIPAGTTVRGTVVAQGPIEVLGRVEGSVVSLAGDVTVHRGGVVGKDAVAVGGHVNADSGQVLGEIRAMSALPALLGTSPAVLDVRTPAQRTLYATKLVACTFGVLLFVAAGVLLFAGRNLDEVVATIESQFVRTFWFGILGQLAVLPALLVLIVACVLSLIGILLIPFAIVAYAIAAAGLITLGFLAVARLVGGALWQRGDGQDRMRALGALAMGIALFFVLWMVAALVAWAPMAATVVRAAALAATWAAVTLGLGAAILSRAGTHRRVAGAVAGRPPELAAWQTPTPIAGIPAARRTVGAARERR
ncbi:MAG: hypothetical protein JWM95_620 [Gemmatimonadetes bacterium]|nr:hypothetical protein [Gemmatimonadota bacterium]